MNYIDGQFVALPRITKLNKLKLQYKDTLTYIALRSFNGSEGCFPSYEAIATKAKCSRNFIMASLKRLEQSGLINVNRFKRRLVKDRLPVNEYTFKRFDSFDPIPYEIFDTDLDLHDKAMLLSIIQFFYNSKMKPLYNTIMIAKELQLSTRIVQQRFRSLIELGFIMKLNIPRSRRRFGCKYELSSKVNWIWKLGKIKSEDTTSLLMVG